MKVTRVRMAIMTKDMIVGHCQCLSCSTVWDEDELSTNNVTTNYCCCLLAIRDQSISVGGLTRIPFLTIELDDKPSGCYLVQPRQLNFRKRDHATRDSHRSTMRTNAWNSILPLTPTYEQLPYTTPMAVCQFLSLC